MFTKLLCACLIALPHFLFAQLNADTLIKRLGHSFIDDKKTVGLSIGVYHNGHTYFYNFGTTQKDKTQLPTPHSLYEIGSVTKSFVALILSQAVVDKKVKRTDDIRNYLDAEYPNLQFDNVPITLAQLANGTSGLPDWLPATPNEIKNATDDARPALREKIYGAFTPTDFFTALHKVQLDTVPGFKRSHSNAAAQLLSYILEKVYNASMDQLIKKFILGPANMTSTTFLASRNNKPALTTGYDGHGNKAPYFNTNYLQFVGGLYSTTADLLQFVKLQLERKDSAVVLSQQESFNAGYFSVCLNWLKYKHENGNHQYWTDGGTYGYVSYVVFYPEINAGIVLLANAGDDSIPGKLGDMAYQVFDYLQRHH